MENLLTVALMAMLPISELRGSIPAGVLMFGLPLWQVFLISVIFNALAFFPIFFGLEFFYDKVFKRWNLPVRLLNRSRNRAKPYIRRYGIVGLALFVAVPLPLTGAWTGTEAAWVLGLGWKKSFLAVTMGVLLSGTIITMLVSLIA